MALRTLTRIYKDTARHTFDSLEVNEVSLVTDPAIITKDEADSGAGFVVIKMASGSDDDGVAKAKKVPAAELPTEDAEGVSDPEGAAPKKPKKKVAPLEGSPLCLAAAEVCAKHVAAGAVVKFVLPDETVDVAVHALLDAALTRLMNFLDDQDVWWNKTPMRITGSEIIFADAWMYEDPTAHTFYRMVFTRDDTGSFTFEDPIALHLEFVDGAVVAKVLSPQEKAMLVKGIRVGDAVIKVTVKPESELVLGDVTVAKIDSKGDATLADGYTVDDEGFVTKVAVEEGDAPVTKEAPAAEAPDVSANGLASAIAAYTKASAASGQSMSMNFHSDGSFEISPVAMPNETPAAEESPAGDDLSVATEKLLSAVETMKSLAAQRSAGSASTDASAQVEAAVAAIVKNTSTGDAPDETNRGVWSDLIGQNA